MLFWVCLAFVFSALKPILAASPTSLDDRIFTLEKKLNSLIKKAIEMDAGTLQYSEQISALKDMGIANSTLIDPKFKFGVGGLPVNTFKFNQDPMTNISVALMQQFERGSTRELKKIKADKQADGMQYQIALRNLEIINNMTQLWLELGYQQQAYFILEKNKNLMIQLSDFIKNNYAVGKNEAQDLLNSQLQISQLDEKLHANKQIQERIISQFSQWLGFSWLNKKGPIKATNYLSWRKLNHLLKLNKSNDHYQYLNKNPSVKMLNSLISVNQTQLDIARQAYKPQFGVEVMYGYRQADGMNNEQAPNLLSAYLTFDIPLFTDKRQDKVYAATQHQVGAVKSQKTLLLMQLNAKVNALLVDKSNLEQRLERYQNTLRLQAKARINAVERGYENNTSQFNDVIIATRDELNLQLEQQRLITDLNIVNSQLAFLLNGFELTISDPNKIN